MLPKHARLLSRLLEKLPCVGERTAARHVLFLLSQDRMLSDSLGEALSLLHDRVGFCPCCGGLSEMGDGQDASLCEVCRDETRDKGLLCVVTRPQDLAAIEQAGALRGRYFVLGKLVSPLEGIGPDDLPLERLRNRIREDSVREVIIATPPSMDGEATAMWLSRELLDLGVLVSRIASGVPHGGEIEYADRITLGQSISNRQPIK